MLLEFTKSIGRYKEGAQHDYPKSVWEKLAEDAGMKLEDFTRAIENRVLQSSLKRKPNLHKRLGATQ